MPKPLWILGRLQAGSFAESYLIKGVEFQIGHEAIAPKRQQPFLFPAMLVCFKVQTSGKRSRRRISHDSPPLFYQRGYFAVLKWFDI
jgi:hypothetical protein